MTVAADPRPAALDWLMRLPMLGSYELSMLLDLRESLAAALLAQLERDGWLESVVVSSPEFEPARLYALSEDGLHGLIDGMGSDDRRAPLSASRRLVESYLAQIEITVSVNRFAAELVAALRGQEGVVLGELRSLPLRRPRSACWPPAVEAYGCLRAGARHAPFFLAWDRAGAPAFHRRSRVSGWYAFRDREQPWGGDFPAILVVCPGATESAEWERAVLAAADRRGGRPLPVLLAEIDAAFSVGPLDAIWRRPGGSTEASLIERLSWRWNMPEAIEFLRLASVPERAASSGVQGRALRTTSAHPLGLSLSVSATEKRLIEWLAFHPLLTAEELGVLLRSRYERCEALLTGLVERGLIDSVLRPAQGETMAIRRYVLTAEGLKLLALRDGVPPRRYLRHGAVAAAVPGGWAGGGRLQTLLRQFEHTVGVNRFFVRLVADANAHGAQVVRWLSASEATKRFVVAGETHWLRPDGAADVCRDGKLYRLYLEWDRGTMRMSEMKEKWYAYGASYASLDRPPDSLPFLLIVTTTPQREAEIWRALETGHSRAPELLRQALTSVKTLVDRLGAFGCVWQGANSSTRRPLWLEDPEYSVGAEG